VRLVGSSVRVFCRACHRLISYAYISQCLHLMGVPTSEVGYTAAMPRREDHEVHKGHVVALGKTGCVMCEV